MMQQNDFDLLCNKVINVIGYVTKCKSNVSIMIRQSSSMDIGKIRK